VKKKEDKKRADKVAAHLKKNPTKADKPGFIYVYSIKADKRVKGAKYYKIGKTTRNVEERLKEHEKRSDIILEYAFWTKHCGYTERLLHLIFDKQRIYRYRLPEGERKLCSIWKHNRTPVTSADSALKSKYGFKGAKKHIEWFLLKWNSELLPVLETVATDTYKK
jgi:hypothetical protein